MQAAQNGAILGFVQGAAQGGLKAGVKQGIIGGLTAGLTKGLADKIGHGYRPGPVIGQMVLHGAIAELKGGKFKHGAISALASKVGSHYSQRYFGKMNTGTKSDMYGRTAVAVMFGGLASEASGGSFEDGAMSALFVHLFNDSSGMIMPNLGRFTITVGGCNPVSASCGRAISDDHPSSTVIVKNGQPGIFVARGHRARYPIYVAGVRVHGGKHATDIRSAANYTQYMAGAIENSIIGIAGVPISAVEMRAINHAMVWAERKLPSLTDPTAISALNAFIVDQRNYYNSFLRDYNRYLSSSSSRRRAPWSQSR